LVGDFNLPDIQWEAGQAHAKVDAELLEAIQAAGLEQLIDFPTHTKGNILDLILTNIPDRIHNIEEKGRLGRSDHCAISFEVTAAMPKKQPAVVKNWKRADWASIRSGISDTIWPTATDSTSVEEFWQQIRGRLKELTDTYVPEREIRASKATWMTRGLLQLIRRKRRLWKKAKYGEAVEEYEMVSREVRKKNQISEEGHGEKISKGRPKKQKNRSTITLRTKPNPARPWAL
jgi:hypothetical protein